MTTQAGLMELLIYINIAIICSLSSDAVKNTSQIGIAPVRIMAYPDPLNDQVKLDDAAALLKLLAEPMRLRLLSLLGKKEYCVKELVDLTGAGQANVSKHLSLLNMQGVVSRRKVGLYTYYSVSNPGVFAIIDNALTAIKNK